MKRYLLAIIVIICSSILSFSQETNIDSQKSDIPKVICLTLPTYPVSGEILSLEGKVSVSIQINPEGRINSINFNDGLILFQNRIKRVLPQWKFEESDIKIREVTINFEFVLLPSDSESSISAEVVLPNTIKIYGKKAILIDSSSH